MQRIGNLYSQIYDIDNIKLAIKNASKNKRNRRYVRKILINIDEYAKNISEMLREQNYNFSKNRTHVIIDGSSKKERLITVPNFYPDQIIHWATMQIISPILFKSMYRYSCGSVPGRGGLEVKRYIDKTLKQKKSKYILKLDIHHFFPSVNNDKLKFLFQNKFKDKKLLQLLNDIIDAGGAGLPIGYYTSQWFSNFYLNNLDHFIKQELKIQYYVRYVDDMVLMGPNKRKLHKARLAIQDFLSNYDLTLKSQWQLWKKNTRPLDFVGYRFYGHYTLLRKQIFYNLTRIVRRIKQYGLCLPRARRFLSLSGWTKRINFKNYYLKAIKPLISKRKAKKYIRKQQKQQHIKYLRI